MTYVNKPMSSPIGTLRLVASQRGVAAVLWDGENGGRVRLGPSMCQPDHPILLEAERQLTSYFDGRLKAFDLPLDFRGTDFQKRVWRVLTTIPWGETRSYGQIAREIGHPTACRAVGAANGRNPIGIIAPCHRVIGSTGRLTGFAGGLPAKDYLLKLERGSHASLFG